MRNKTILIIILIFVIFIPLVLFVLKPSSSKISFFGAPTPTPFPSNNSSSTQGVLTVISTSPSNNSVNVPLDSTISVFFNQSVKPTDFEFSSVPQIPGPFTIQSNKLILTPNTPLLSSTKYVAVVLIKTPGKTKVNSFTFTTFGPSPTPFQIQSDPSAENSSQQYELQNYPDAFLRNHTPYSSSSFSVTSEYTNIPSGHFFFSVTLKGANKDTSKSSLITWIKSKGLTDSQIQNLDIRYK